MFLGNIDGIKSQIDYFDNLVPISFAVRCQM